MFIPKKLRELDKEIINGYTAAVNSRANNEIHVKINSREELFSQYSNSDEQLNAELSEYVREKCKSVPFDEDPTVVIHGDCGADAKCVANAFKNNYRAEYVAARKTVTRNTLLSIIMTIFGIITLSLLFALHYLFDNVYVTTILEIAAWVFIWEAVDCFFLQRPTLKKQCLILQRAYSAKIVVAQTDVEE